MGGVEVGGHGLTERDGTPSERAHRAAQIARSVRHAQLTRCAPSPAAIAIVDDPRSRIVAAGEGSDREIVQAQRDCYAALRSRGFAVDFVSLAQAAAGLSAERWRLVIVPFAYVLEASVAEGLRRYVEAGGYLVAGLFCGVKDGDGFGQDVVPGHGLDRVLGCRERRVLPCFAPTDDATSTLGSAYEVPMTGRPRLRVTQALHERAGLRPDGELTGYKFLELFEPAPDARVIATDERGGPVVVAHRFGRGRTLTIGTLPGRTADFADDGFARLLEDAAVDAGVAPAAVVERRGGRSVEARVLIGPEHAVLVVLNSTAEDVRESIQVNAAAFRRARDLATGQPVTVDGRRVIVEVPARDARALLLEAT
jgi:hypothetical protein